jgi:polyhydroxyalkanoate synthase
VINPPAANKHGYWTSDAKPATADEWLESASKHEGSWWPYWDAWLIAHGSGERVPARKIKDGLEPAPGSYAKAP